MNRLLLKELLCYYLETKNFVIYLFIVINILRTIDFFVFGLSYGIHRKKTLYIECPDIGGGFFIQHGFATYIAAQKIGKNFSVNQQVTIGYRGTGTPTIGNNCMVTCGAKVLGNITIGDNTRIGANAVVLKDYKRGHEILVGVPAVPKNESGKERLKSLGIEFDESLFN